MIPLHLFIDTSCYWQEQFQFHKSPLATIKKLASEGKVQLHSTEMSDIEVYGKITAMARDACQVHQKFVRESSILYASEDSSLVSILSKLDPVSVSTKVNEKYREFLKSCNSLSHTLTRTSVNKVLVWYAEKRLPFEAKKMWEFPDAFALAVLNEIAESQAIEVVVVSNDKGILRACDDLPKLKGCEGLEKFLNIATLTDTAVKCHNKYAVALETRFQEVFNDDGSFLYLEVDYEGEIAEIEIEKFRVSNAYIIDSSDDCLKLGLQVHLTLSAEIDYKDPDSGYWDDDTGETEYLGSIRERRRFDINFKAVIAYSGNWQEGDVDQIIIESINDNWAIPLELDRSETVEYYPPESEDLSEGCYDLRREDF